MPPWTSVKKKKARCKSNKWSKKKKGVIQMMVINLGCSQFLYVKKEIMESNPYKRFRIQYIFIDYLATWLCFIFPPLQLYVNYRGICLSLLHMPSSNLGLKMPFSTFRFNNGSGLSLVSGIFLTFYSTHMCLWIAEVELPTQPIGNMGWGCW